MSAVDWMTLITWAILIGEGAFVFWRIYKEYKL